MKSIKFLGLAGASALVIAAIALSVQAVSAQAPTPQTGKTQSSTSSSTATDAAQCGPADPGGRGGRGGPGGRGGQGPGAGSVVTVTGTVKEYTINPEGDYNGFALSDGTQVEVPPQDGVKVKALFAAGDSVQVQGYQRTDPAGKSQINATTISSGSKTYTAEKPAQPTAPPTSTTTLVTTTVSAAITQLSTNDRGELDGIYLGSTTLVRLPPQQSDALKAKLTVGTTVEVTGDKRVGTSGLTVIRAQQIKVNGETILTAPAQNGPHGDRGPRGQQQPPDAQQQAPDAPADNGGDL